MLTDTLPTGTSLVSANPAQSSGPNPLLWNLGDLVNGQVVTVTIQVRVTTASGNLLNTAQVSTTIVDPIPGNNTSSTSTTLLAPGIAVQKSVSVGQVVRSMPFSYTIRIDNTGQVPLDPLIITDTLPVGFNLVAGSATPQQPDQVALPRLVWNNLGPLAVGQAITVTFSVTATPGITGTYVNTVDALGSYICIALPVTCGSVQGTDTASVAVAGDVVTPTGIRARLRTVWIIETGETLPRFVTAYLQARE